VIQVFKNSNKKFRAPKTQNKIKKSNALLES